VSNPVNRETDTGENLTSLAKVVSMSHNQRQPRIHPKEKQQRAYLVDNVFSGSVATQLG